MINKPDLEKFQSKGEITSGLIYSHRKAFNGFDRMAEVVRQRMIDKVNNTDTKAAAIK